MNDKPKFYSISTALASDVWTLADTTLEEYDVLRGKGGHAIELRPPKRRRTIDRDLAVKRFDVEVSLLALHKDLIFKFEEMGFTGFSAKNISVSEKNIPEIDDFRLLTIDGYCGKIDDSKSFTKEIEYPIGPVEKKFGLFFDLENWTKEDFFTPEGTNLIFVTSRVQKFLDSNYSGLFEIRDCSTMQNYSVN